MCGRGDWLWFGGGESDYGGAEEGEILLSLYIVIKCYWVVEISHLERLH